MDELDRLEAEANRRSTALARAASRLARRFQPLRLADETLGRLGPASEVVERASRVMHRHPVVAAAFAASAAFLGWQLVRSGSLARHPGSRRIISSRRQGPGSRPRLVPARPIHSNEGAEA